MATQDLLPLQGSKSQVWKHFGFPAKDGEIIEKKKDRKIVTCKLCFKNIKFSGNTTNLRFHLNEHHRSAYESLPVDDKSSKQSTSTSQCTILQAMNATQKIPTTSPTWNRFTDAVCYFIAKDLQPLDTVDDKGFCHLLRTIEPRYELPSRKALTTKYLPQLFDGVTAKVKKELSSSSSFALTADLWTSRASHAYTGVTVHYINNTFELKHHLLVTKEFPESHSAANIADELRNIIQEWDLTEQNISAITTDNGRNIAAAARELGWTNLPCFSHTLQLGVDKILKLPQVTKAIARCKRITTHFHHSSKSSYVHKQKKKVLDIKNML